MNTALARQTPVTPTPAEATPRSVCFIVQNEGFGGMEVHTLAVMDALIRKGYRIELVSNQYERYDAIIAERGWANRIRIIHTDLPGILYGTWPDRRRWREVLSTLQSRVLIFPKGDNNYGQPGFLRECRRVFDRIVFVEHQGGRPRPALWAGRPYRSALRPGLWWHKRRVTSRIGARSADVIVAVSETVRQRLIHEIGFPPEKTVVVRNGIPWRSFQRDLARREAFRRKHAIGDDTIVFGMLTRLSPVKGVDIAIQAVKHLAGQAFQRPYTLVIAGEGPEYVRLESMVASLNLGDRIRFIGFVEPRDVLSGYDVILFSSRLEGMPLGLLEGMASGCVPVVTRTGGMPEAVDSPDIGWVVPPENPAALADAMRSVLSMDRGSFSRMRERTVARVRDQFDIASSLDRIIELCR